jgi:hypothetical protein
LQASPAAEKIDMTPKTHAKRARGDAVGKGKKLCSSTNRGSAEAEAGTENAQPGDGAGGVAKDDGKKRRKKVGLLGDFRDALLSVCLSCAASRSLRSSSP